MIERYGRFIYMKRMIACLLIYCIAVMMLTFNGHDKQKREIAKVKNGEFVDEFRLVADDKEMFVYAAYYDERIHKVRVIGITKNTDDIVYCLQINRKLMESKLTTAEVVCIYDHKKNVTFHAAFILCDCQADVPQTVTIFKGNSTENARNSLTVRRKSKLQTSLMFTLCLSPLHSYFNCKWQLVEWIEMNMILGVEKINIYVQNCSLAVLNILKIYESKGVVNIIHWSLPFVLSNKRNKRLHYYGQLAAINDCIYRNMGLSMYTAVFDVDEYIIPQFKEDLSWFDMFARLPNANAYIFRTSFFIRNETGNISSQQSITNASFIRQKFIYPPHIRSKFIVKTNKIYTADIHFIREMHGKEHFVDPNIGLLHHYRRVAPNYSVEPLDDSIKVNIEATRKYSHFLRKRMAWFLD